MLRNPFTVRNYAYQLYKYTSDSELSMVFQKLWMPMKQDILSANNLPTFTLTEAIDKNDIQRIREGKAFILVKLVDGWSTSSSTPSALSLLSLLLA